jgi:hypothetical protein
MNLIDGCLIVVGPMMRSERINDLYPNPAGPCHPRVDGVGEDLVFILSWWWSFARGCSK